MTTDLFTRKAIYNTKTIGGNRLFDKEDIIICKGKRKHSP